MQAKRQINSEQAKPVEAAAAPVSEATEAVAMPAGEVASPMELSTGLGQTSCSWTSGSGSYYDLSSISSLDYTASDGTYTYKLHMCGNVGETGCAAKAGSLCQYGASGAYGHMLSSWSTAPNGVFTQIDQSNPAKGFSVAFANGDLCSNAGVTKPRTVTMVFPCTPNQQGTTYQIVTTPTNPCDYTTTFATSAGCPGTAPSGSGVGGLSLGSALLIIIFVCAPLYVLIGCIYKRQKQGTQGIESCPNIDFWRDLPQLVKEGCSFTLSKLRGLRGGGTGSGYETVK